MIEAKTLYRILAALLLLGQSPLIGLSELSIVDAVKQGETSAVRELLRGGADVNLPAVDGTTALHWAVRRDDLETARLLVRAGAKVNTANRYGVAPLSLAATNGSADIVELLLSAGADPNTMLPEGESVLMTAALTGKVDAVKSLLDHGAKVNLKEDWQGQTALMWAAAEGNSDVVQILIQYGADVRARSKGGFTPLLFAVREGHIQTVRVLLEAGVDVNEALPGRAAQRGAAGSGPSALMLATANAHFELAAFLLDRKADPNYDAQGWTALHQLTWVRKPGLGGNNPAPEGSGRLESLDLVRKLVAAGADVNARIKRRPNAGTTDLNLLGATPFLMAARTADAELMRLLAALGADPLTPNEDNTTPLLAAAGVGTRFPQQEDPGTVSEVYEAVKVAIELGGDVNSVDNNGETVMHGAAYKLAHTSVKYLVEKGARIDVWNKENKFGWTPLRIAQGVVQRDNNTRPSSPEMIAAISEVMPRAASAGAGLPQKE